VKLHKPNSTQEREAERFRLAFAKLERTERRMRRAMLAWLKAKDAMQRLERRSTKKPAEIPGDYDPRELADLSRFEREPL
jgi:hypothetical protein